MAAATSRASARSARWARCSTPTPCIPHVPPGTTCCRWLTADHLVIIGRGKLIADTPTLKLVESSARADMLVRSPRAGELAGLLTARGATVTAEDDGALAVTGMDAPAIGDLAAAHGIAIHELARRHASLEQAYLDLTGDSTSYAGRPAPGLIPAGPAQGA